MTGWEVRLGDCVALMQEMEDASVDAVVTDPPYGLEFMGAEWDRLDGDVRQPGDENYTPSSGPYGRAKVRHGGTPAYRGKGMGPEMQAWHLRWAREAFRVLKPGGHLLAFGGSRTSHRLASAVEDAGFEIRDSIQWWYASGFPKSLDVADAVDRHLGVEPRVVGVKDLDRKPTGVGGIAVPNTDRPGAPVTEPTTPEARQWHGWGTALKPANEPIVVGRKPLVGAVAANVLRFGTGAINVDGCRLKTADSLGGGDESAAPKRKVEGWHRPWMEHEGQKADHAARVRENVARAETLGRWPANVMLSHADGCVLVGAREVSADGHFPAARGPGGLGVTGHSGQEGLEERFMDGEVVEQWECAEGCPAAALDAQVGARKAGGSLSGSEPSVPLGGVVYGDGAVRRAWDGYQDSGGPSRFFFRGKASRAERDAGLEGTGRSVEFGQTSKVRECNVCGSRSKQAMNPVYPTCGHEDWALVPMRDVEGVIGVGARNSHPT